MNRTLQLGSPLLVVWNFLSCGAGEEPLPGTDAAETGEVSVADTSEVEGAPDTDAGDSEPDPDVIDGSSDDDDLEREIGSDTDSESDVADDADGDACRDEGSGECPAPDALTCAGEAFPPDIETCSCPGTDVFLVDGDGCYFSCWCPLFEARPQWKCTRMSSPCDEEWPTDAG